MSSELRDVIKYNKNYWTLINEYGQILPFHALFNATTGHGKGLTMEFLVEEWKKKTNGVVIYLIDPKDEGEATFCQYLPKEKYHIDRLSRDGMKPEKHNCKVYHPFTFNIPKQYLPPINFFTIPVKSLNKEELGLLAESSWDSASIKLMLRVSQDLGRKSGIMKYLHEIERMTKVKKKNKEPVSDPKNWRLHSGGGSAKDVAEIGNLLSPFKKDYFLSNDLCPHNLNFKEILQDNQNYHIFLTMFLSEGTRKKLKGFIALYLLNKIIENRKYLKKPLLILIPEIKIIAPRNPQGYRFYLSQAFSEALVTVRNKGKGISSIGDTQVWSDTDDKIKSAFNLTFFGKLNPKDREIVTKACSYGRNEKDLLKDVSEYKCSYICYDKEDEGIFRFFMPRHMHKEINYNWIEMYKEHFPKKTQRYDNLIEEMKNRWNEEDKEIEEMLKKRNQIEKEEIEKEEREKKRKEKEEKNKEKEKKIEESIDVIKEAKQKMCYKIFKDESIPSKEKTYRAIARKIRETFNEQTFSHLTAKKYIQEYEKKLNSKDINHMIGDGVLEEEVESNFGNSKQE
jgi:hypothetical protein